MSNSTNTPCYLGISLTQTHLTAVVLSNTLAPIRTESIEFDVDLREYGTRNGAVPNHHGMGGGIGLGASGIGGVGGQGGGGPGGGPEQPQNGPVEMYLRALELLLDRLQHPPHPHQLHNIEEESILSRVKSTTITAFSAPIFYTSTTTNNTNNLVHTLALPTVPLPTSLVSAQHATALLSSLGGKAKLVGKVGVMPHSGMLGPQILRCREELGGGWERVKRIGTLAGFLRDVLCGTVHHGMREDEARLSAMWNVREENWDRDVSRILFGEASPSPGGSSMSEKLLGPVEVNMTSTHQQMYKIGSYWTSRYPFNGDVTITPPLPDVLSNYLSFSPCSYKEPASSSTSLPPPSSSSTSSSPAALPAPLLTTTTSSTTTTTTTTTTSASSSSFAIMSFSPFSSDTVLAPISPSFQTCPVPNKMCAFLPHPCPPPLRQNNNKKHYLAYLESHLSHQARTLVRDMYTKSWSAFDRLVAIVPGGGSIGLDNKLFAFWVLGGDSYPYIFGTRNGVWRFETGARVHEFRDLRANPRCLIEGQLIGMRVRWGRLSALGIVQGRSPTVTSSSTMLSTAYLKEELGFDPYSNGHLPRKLFCEGMMSQCGSVVNVLTDVWDGEVWVGTGALSGGVGGEESEDKDLHLQQQQQQHPSRNGVGAAYFAWYLDLVRSRSSSSSSQNGSLPPVGEFEEEVGKMILLREQEKERERLSRAAGIVTPGGGNGNGGGTGGRSPRPGSTVNGGAAGSGGLVRTSSRSGLSAFMLHDEDEDQPVSQQQTSPYPPQNQYFPGGPQPPNQPSPSIPSTTPNAFNFLPSPSPNNAFSPSAASTAYTTPDPSSLPFSSSQGQQQQGMFRPVTPIEEGAGLLVKVGEPDHDAFMQYAALVPEYCRLEGLVVRDAV